MSDRARDRQESRESLARQVVEFFACLTMAVMLFQTFHAEAYVIPTGSMAPTLIGFHKQVNCPTCRFEFALGVTDSYNSSLATCPNCGQTDIDVLKLIQNDGDRLLVHKSAYAFRDPERWEVVVFRNPRMPTEAYVKRLVGLPGETIEIRDGDIYVGGEIRTKELATQRGIRILVNDHDFRPPRDEHGAKPRWVADEPWTAQDGGFSIDAPPGGSDADSRDGAWITYRHWIRAGGSHSTVVPLSRLPADFDLSQLGGIPVRFDEREGLLHCRGVMPDGLAERLLGATQDATFRQAVTRLYEESHVAPITDCYGYNRFGDGGTGGGETPVRDLMLAVRVQYESGQGEFQIQFAAGTEVFAAVFDFVRNQVRLESAGAVTPLRTSALPAAMLEGAAEVEFSVMDRQVLLAVNGKPVFAPFDFKSTYENAPPPRRPVRMGARGLRIHVDSIRLYRDVYYTLAGMGSTNARYRLRNDEKRREYFALGDNSPVSVDSRVWPSDRAVTQELLLGKPFLVHLPARTQKVRWGNWEGYLRIPDISRIRYIH